MLDSALDRYRELVEEFRKIRKVYGNFSSGEEGAILDDIEATWQEMSEDEKRQAKQEGLITGR